MTPGEVGEMVRWILGAWPTLGAKVDREAMTLAWGAALMDLDSRKCQAAIVELSKTEEWFPSIAAIRARVMAMNHGEVRIGIEAWGDVVRAMRITGRYGTPVFPDALIAVALADVGGWLAVCDSRIGDPAIRARFCERYDQLAGHMRRVVQLSPGATVRSLPRSETTRELGGIVRVLLATTEEHDDDDED